MEKVNPSEKAYTYHVDVPHGVYECFVRISFLTDKAVSTLVQEAFTIGVQAIISNYCSDES